MSTFYNRDRNISGIATISSLTYDPVYGSRVSFNSMANTYFTRDGYFNSIPLSPNSLSAEYELRYDLNELDSQKLVDFIESKNGEDFIAFTDSSSFYKTLSGFSDSYAINHINKNHYEVAIKMNIDRAPTLLNWSGMTFVNTTFQNWQSSRTYEKYDIVYSAVSSNKLNNYYYCIGDHYSDSSNSPDKIGLNDINYLIDSLNFSTSNWSTGSDLGSFFTTSASTIITPNNDLTATRFTSTATTSQGLFLRARQSEPSNNYILSIYLYVPTQVGVTNWGLVLDAADSSDIGSSNTQTTFDQWVKISIPIQYTSTRIFLDFNIRANGGAPTTAGFILHAWSPSLNLDVNPMWTQNFFFEPDLGLQNNVDLKVGKINFKNSFPQRMKTEKNIAKTDFNYKFTNITTKKAKAIIHFLENKGGYRRFLHNAPSIYNRPKVFYAPSWNHTFKYYDSHDIEVNLIEDPLGIIPTGS